MVGKGLSSRAAAHSSARWNISSTRARSDSPSSFKSEPAEKFSPSPRSTRTRTLSALDTRCTSRVTVSHISEFMAFIFSGRRNEIRATPPATCKPTSLRLRSSPFSASSKPFPACVEDPNDIAPAILPQMMLGRQAQTSLRPPTCRLDITFTPLSRGPTKICDDHHIPLVGSQGGSRERRRPATVTGPPGHPRDLERVEPDPEQRSIAAHNPGRRSITCFGALSGRCRRARVELSTARTSTHSLLQTIKTPRKPFMRQAKEFSPLFPAKPLPSWMKNVSEVLQRFAGIPRGYSPSRRGRGCETKSRSASVRWLARRLCPLQHTRGARASWLRTRSGLSGSRRPCRRCRGPSRARARTWTETHLRG